MRLLRRLGILLPGNPAPTRSPAAPGADDEVSVDEAIKRLREMSGELARTADLFEARVRQRRNTGDQPSTGEP